MAKLYQHRTDSTYYTKWRLGAGSVTWQVHPDGVRFLKKQGVVVGGDIPSYAMRILNDRNWLFTREEAGQWREIDWAPDWGALGGAPAGHYPLWLSRQTRDCDALLAASRRLAEGEQLAHHKEEAAARRTVSVSAPPSQRSPRVASLATAASGAVALAHPEESEADVSSPVVDKLLWPVVVMTALMVIAMLAIAG